MIRGVCPHCGSPSIKCICPELQKIEDETGSDPLHDLVVAASDVLRGLRLTPGGDAYEYHGSMNDVNWLREAVEALRNAAFSATKDEEDDEP